MEFDKEKMEKELLRIASKLRAEIENVHLIYVPDDVLETEKIESEEDE